MSARESALVGLWSHPKKEVCPAVLDLSHKPDHQRGLLLARCPPLWSPLHCPLVYLKRTFHRDSSWATYLPCISTYEGVPGSSAGKESTCSAGDLGSIPELGRSPGEGNGYPLQYSCLENPCGQRSMGGVQSMGSQRSGHKWATKHTFISTYAAHWIMIFIILLLSL